MNIINSKHAILLLTTVGLSTAMESREAPSTRARRWWSVKVTPERIQAVKILSEMSPLSSEITQQPNQEEIPSVRQVDTLRLLRLHIEQTEEKMRAMLHEYESFTQRILGTIRTAIDTVQLKMVDLEEMRREVAIIQLKTRGMSDQVNGDWTVDGHTRIERLEDEVKQLRKEMQQFRRVRKEMRQLRRELEECKASRS